MIKMLAQQLRPSRGFAHIFHIVLVVVLPIIMFVLVRIDFEVIALVVLLLSKWRIFAVSHRHWAAHLRTNAVDIIVGASILAFMSQADSAAAQLAWVAFYELWLLVIKPGANVVFVSLQAVISQFLGLTAIFLAFPEAPLGIYVVVFGAIAYFSARHFFGSFEEPQAKVLASIWAFFSAGLMWVLGHWLLYIGPIAQPAILLSVLGYGLAGLYYLDETDKLSSLVRRQIIMVMFAVVLVMIFFSDWGDKVTAPLS